MILKKLNVRQAEPKTDDENNIVLSYVASTGDIDRYGDVIDQESWKLEAYKSNPIVLFNHNQSALPIGKGSVDIVDGQLMIDVEFDMQDPEAANIARKAKDGFLNAVSVGFQPHEFYSRSELPKDHKAFGESGNYFLQNELLEVSIVTVPANANATAAKGYKGFEDFLRNESNRHSTIKSIQRHIVYVAEEDDHWVVHFAKGEKPEAETEEESAELAENDEKFLEEFLETQEDREGYHEEEDDEEDKKDKSLSNENLAFLRALTKEEWEL